MTEDEFKAWIKHAWAELPPSGTDVSQMTEKQKAAFREMIHQMEDGTPGAGDALKRFFT